MVSTGTGMILAALLLGGAALGWRMVHKAYRRRTRRTRRRAETQRHARTWWMMTWEVAVRGRRQHRLTHQPGTADAE
jgi:Flp pilus assembly protein TadB